MQQTATGSVGAPSRQLPDWVCIQCAGHPQDGKTFDRRFQAILLHPKLGDHDIRTLRERALVASGEFKEFRIDAEENVAEVYGLSLF